MASIWPWPFACALATRSASLSRSDWLRTGAATSIASSNASDRIVFGGALPTGARRMASNDRAESSISTASRAITSSNSAISSSESFAASTMKRSVTWRSISARRPLDPTTTARSSALIRLASAAINRMVTGSFGQPPDAPFGREHLSPEVTEQSEFGRSQHNPRSFSA